MIGIIISMLGGIMAAASLILSFNPKSKSFFNKINPYQGIIGIVLLAWGVWSLIQLIKLLALGGFSLSATTFVAIQLIVGFLLSFGLLSQLIFSKSEETKQKGENLRVKLSPYQGIFGLALIGLSIWSLINFV